MGSKSNKLKKAVCVLCAAAQIAAALFVGVPNIAEASDADGSTVRGMVKTYNPKARTTISLKQGGEVAYETTTDPGDGDGDSQAEQAFSLSGVRDGLYDLVVTKPAHASFTAKNLAVRGADVNISAIPGQSGAAVELACGDVNGDGLVNDGDLSVLWNASNFNRRTETVFDKLTDLNGDDLVNDGDLSVLWGVSNYNKGSSETDLGGDQDSGYIVSFVDWNGAQISAENVPEGGSAALPASPSRAGYIFAGWDGPYKPVTRDTVVKARYVQEGSSNIFSASSVSGKPGDLVTTKLTLGGVVNTCSFDMRLTYDSDALEYVSANVDFDLDVGAFHDTVAKVVRFNFSSGRNRTQAAELMEVIFRVKDSAIVRSQLGLLSVEVNYANPDANDDPTPIAHGLVNGFAERAN